MSEAYCDTRCRQCGAKIGWFGNSTNAPPCPKCRCPQDIEALEKDEEHMREFEELLLSRKKAKLPLNEIYRKFEMQDLDKRFDFHGANEHTAIKHEMIRGACKGLASFIIERTPVGREQSLAITKLEEVMMWANAAIAREGK